MADFQAKFLAFLSAGKLPIPGERQTLRTPAAKTTRKTTSAKKIAPRDRSSSDKNTATTHIGRGEREHDVSSPSIHLDVQIHLDPATDPAQIDAVFASLARHIYGK
jgi:hypothetical protein